MFMKRSVEGSTLWLYTNSTPQGHNLIDSSGSYNRIRTCRLRGRYLSLICFHTNTHSITLSYTRCPSLATRGYEGGRWWMARISWEERQERVKWTVLVLRSMYAHTLLYFYRGQLKNLGYSTSPFLCVLSAKIPVSLQNQSAVNIKLLTTRQRVLY